MADPMPRSWRTNSGRSLHSSLSKKYNDGGDGDLPTSFRARGSANHENMSRDDYKDMEQKVQEYFGKKFFFQPPMEGWNLPAPENMFQAEKWQEEKLQRLKAELNRVKSKLDLYKLNDWHKHTRTMNKAGEIQWKLRKEYEPEFLTQAWCKFYENAMSFPLVPPKVVETGCLNSVHLCEAPGAFITSLNHYLALQSPDIKWKWQATTLNPYYEGNPLSCMINDDRFILQTLEHWKFGLDYTGDLMNVNNMMALVEDADQMGPVLLVTADGSIDCQEDPGEQESIVSSLHYCESVAALHILSEGGSFLLKMFTMYEHETVCLMYLLACSFSCVRVFKPATSKEGNSEVYVVCLEYKGRNVMEPWLQVLREHFGPVLPAKAMFAHSDIPRDFIDQLYECTSTFKNYQTEVIETNIRVFEGKRMRGEGPKIRMLKSLIANHFLEIYEMQKLEESSEVVGKSKLKKTMTLNMDPRAEEGSFDERRKKASLAPMELLPVLKNEVLSMNLVWPFQEEVRWIEFPKCVDGFEVKIGKPVKNVQSSKFCLGRLLKIRNQVRSIAKKDLSRRSSLESSGGNLEVESELCNLVRRNRTSVQDFRVLNYKEKLWTSLEGGGNEEAERAAFWDIMDIIDDLWREESLFLQGYPMLTQFNVGMVYMLCHLFDEVGFVKPNKQDFGLIFKGFRKWNPKMKRFLDVVDDQIHKLKSEGSERTVLSLFPINKLCERYNQEAVENGSGDEERAERICDNLFYKCVTEVNHLCVKEQVLDIIDNLQNS